VQLAGNCDLSYISKDEFNSLLYDEGEKKCIRCQGCRLTAGLLRYLDYVFEKAFSVMTQVKTKHAESACSKFKMNTRVCLSTAIQARLVKKFHIVFKINWPWLFVLA